MKVLAAAASAASKPALPVGQRRHRSGVRGDPVPRHGPGHPGGAGAHERAVLVRDRRSGLGPDQPAPGGRALSRQLRDPLRPDRGRRGPAWPRRLAPLQAAGGGAQGAGPGPTRRLRTGHGQRGADHAPGGRAPGRGPGVGARAAGHGRLCRTLHRPVRYRLGHHDGLR